MSARELLEDLNLTDAEYCRKKKQKKGKFKRILHKVWSIICCDAAAASSAHCQQFYYSSFVARSQTGSSLAVTHCSTQLYCAELIKFLTCALLNDMGTCIQVGSWTSCVYWCFGCPECECLYSQPRQWMTSPMKKTWRTKNRCQSHTSFQNWNYE